MGEGEKGKGEGTVREGGGCKRAKLRGRERRGKGELGEGQVKDLRRGAGKWKGTRGGNWGIGRGREEERNWRGRENWALGGGGKGKLRNWRGRGEEGDTREVEWRSRSGVMTTHFLYR